VNKEIEKILKQMEESSTSSGLAVADHIRTVASNGREYSTPDAIAEEASAVIQWAMALDTTLLDAVSQSKAALVGDSNDAEHDALFVLIEALGFKVPWCDCGMPVPHDPDCPQKAWEKGAQ